jgi:hypothetical protein
VSYIGYDTRAMRPIHIGDVVIAEDEWGYYRRSPADHTGRVTWHHGWLTMLERADGTQMCVDGHTTTLSSHHLGRSASPRSTDRGHHFHWKHAGRPAHRGPGAPHRYPTNHNPTTTGPIMDNNYDPRDFRAVEATFNDMFGAYRTGRRMQLRGCNFMTEEVLGILDIDGQLVEVSTGMFLNDRLFGVTFDRPNDGDPSDDRNGSFDTLDEVRQHLMSLGGFRGGDEVLP